MTLSSQNETHAESACSQFKMTYTSMPVNRHSSSFSHTISQFSKSTVTMAMAFHPGL